jgi:hypothetical protein
MACPLSASRRPALIRPRFVFILLFALFLPGGLRVLCAPEGGPKGDASPGGRLEGKITDASTGLPVGAVNVRILGTSRGTVSNADGRYRLPLEPGRQTVVFIHLAYERDTLDVDAPAPGPGGEAVVRDVSLRPGTLFYPEVLVLAEDPALEIIRKAIENKRRWMGLLKTYRFDAYTRQVIEKDTSVASITEAFSTGWALSGDTIRERVVQKRQTANVPMEDNFAAVRRLVNFNDDRITLFSVNLNSERRAFTFTGPTSPDALENYDYRLLKTRRVDGIEMYEIAMTPKTKLRPLFTGTITIADRSFAVVGVDLEPNETFTMPFVKDIALRYRQQFALYDSLFWMPADIRIDGGFSVSVMGISIPRIGFRQVSSIYDYELNVPVPDSVLARRSVTVDSAATATYDSSYWGSGLVVPLTGDESRAYATLDSTETLERQFRPGGIVGALSDDDEGGGTGSLMGLLDARFNRVEGLYLGASEQFRSLIPRTVVGLGAGYPFSDRRVQYALSLTVRPTGSRQFILGAEAYRRAERTDDGGYYPALVNSVTSLLDKNDYHDYYRAEGFTAWTEYSAGRRFRARVFFVSQEESSMPAATDYSWASRDAPFRANPEAAPGTRRSIGATVRFGIEREALDLITNSNLEVTAERSSPSLIRSDFDYTRVSALLTYNLPLFGNDLLFPASFRVRAFAGKGFGALPPQRAFSAETRLSGLALFGTLRTGLVKEYAGDAVVSVSMEQNFRSLPFLALDIPFLYRNGVELIVHGAFAQAWRGDAPLPGGWHSEAGIGVGRIFDLLRLDVTRRFREPARFFVTLGISSFL